LPEPENPAGNRSGSWTVSAGLIEQLIDHADPQRCRDAARVILGAQQP